MSTGQAILGSRISLISRADIRYEGFLYAIDPDGPTLSLAKVKSFGTEDRTVQHPVPPHNETYEYIMFKGSDIKEITVIEPAGSESQLAAQDPAILRVQAKAEPVQSTGKSNENMQRTQSGSGADVPQNRNFKKDIKSSIKGNDYNKLSSLYTNGAPPQPEVRSLFSKTIAPPTGNKFSQQSGFTNNGTRKDVPPGDHSNVSNTSRFAARYNSSYYSNNDRDQHYGARGVSNSAYYGDKSYGGNTAGQVYSSYGRFKQQPFHLRNEGAYYGGYGDYYHQGGANGRFQPDDAYYYSSYSNNGFSDNRNWYRQNGYYPAAINYGGYYGGYRNDYRKSSFRGGAANGNIVSNSGGNSTARKPSYPKQGGSNAGDSGNYFNKKQKYDADYDFETANAQIAEELQKMVINVNLGGDAHHHASPAVSANIVHNTQIDADHNLSDNDNASGSVKSSEKSSGPEKDAYYNKEKCFFDSISSEATDAKNKARTANRREERKLNQETFGVSARQTRIRQYRSYVNSHLRPPGSGGAINHPQMINVK